MAQSQYHPALHTIALLTACATFPLIFMGGLVTSHQAGMSVPDWPNSYGYNMFLFPPRLWIGGILSRNTAPIDGHGRWLLRNPADDRRVEMGIAAVGTLARNLRAFCGDLPGCAWRIARGAGEA